MARARTNKLYHTFVKGLITEASHLTYPEDASLDELNTVISRKGNRTRRVGIDYESDYVLEDLGFVESKLVNSFVWSSVNNDNAVSFLVVQVGNKLHFYKLEGGDASSAALQSFEIDLTTYKIPQIPNSDLISEFAHFSSGFGLLFVAHRYCEPFSVEYKPETDTIEVIRVIIQIRDFEGVYDGLANDEEPTALSPEHHYNLLNQGWITPGSRIVVGVGGIGGGINEGPTGGTGGGVNANGGAVTYDPYTGEPSQNSGGGGGGFGGGSGNYGGENLL